MILLPSDIRPSPTVLEQLRDYQKEIDVLGSFEQRSQKAKEIFSTRNKKGNKAFDAVKVKLTEMCSGARRCVYCEDSVGDEVEHIHPKDLFPSLCFDWDNYVYACGNCNGPKNNKFAVFRKDNGVFQELQPPKGAKTSEPPEGEAVMINPRREDPLNYCMLDLSGTFKFVVIKESIKDKKRAEYTFNEVLRLNEREFLREARKTAYINYKSRLGYYSGLKEKLAPQDKLDELIENLKKESHPTVWKEMQRQYSLGIIRRIDTDLHDLFERSPESLLW
jgi:uncharacterized protein (TIGR02646 family)